MSKARLLLFSLAALGVAALLSSGCATTEEPPAGTIYVSTAPPVLQVETAGVAPEAGYVWVPGYYNWVGTSYVWVPGSWQRPPHVHAVWVAPVWRHHSRGWWRVDGHWK